MATSGSWDYSATAANVIDMALENLGVLAPGATVVTAHQTMLLRKLNTITKQYQGTIYGGAGMPVLTRQRVTLILAKGQHTYQIGPATADARSSTQVGRTTIDAAEAIGQTVLSVTDTSDTTSYPGTTLTMTASDFIGIEQDNGVIFWTTVSSISAGVSVTVGTGIDVAASVGNVVYWFTARAQRFPVIESAVLRNTSLNDTPLEIYTDARQYDQGVADKHGDGTPTAILVEPLRITTRVTLNSQPTDVSDTIVLTVLYPAEDYDATTNDIAFPQEALRFLSWELAFEASPSFGSRWTPVMDKNRNEARAMYLNLNPENSVLYFQTGGL